MAGCGRKEGESYLNPNAVAFQPCIPSQYNQPFAQPVIQNNYQYYPYTVNNQNIAAPGFVSNQFYPQQSQNVYRNYGIINKSQRNLPQRVYRRNTKKIRRQARGWRTSIMHANFQIMYERFEFNHQLAIAKLDIDNHKSRYMQPHSISDIKYIFLNCLVSGYCRNFLLPEALIVLLIKYYGKNARVSRSQFAVGISAVDPVGFVCVEINSGTIIRYLPKTKYAMNDYTIIATTTDLMLPLHFINHYNEITNNALSKHTRFNAMFISRKECELDHTTEILCILFNNEHALEFKLPLFQSSMQNDPVATYSVEHGLLICHEGGLFSFCWNKWRWIEVAHHQYAFNGIKFMHYFEEQNQIYTFSFLTKCCYLYDVNEKKMNRVVPCRDTILAAGDPIFCADNVNQRIFAFQRMGKKNGRGMFICFDISTCQWINRNRDTIPIFSRRKASSVQQIWFRETDQALCAFTSKTKREVPQFWKINTIYLMSKWTRCDYSEFWMQDNIEYTKL